MIPDDVFLNSIISGGMFPGIAWDEVIKPGPWLSGEPDYFGRNEISSGGDLSHYSSASLY